MDWLFTFADPTIKWDEAMILLVVRFIGVFFVMFVMQVALQTSSAVVRRMEARDKALAPEGAGAPAGKPEPESVKAGEPSEPTPAPIDEDAAAAIGLALALEARPAASSADTGTSSWATAGRLAQLNRLPR